MATSAPPLPRARLLRAYRQMKTIREFEERLHVEIQTGEIPGFTHLYSGQEAVAVGVCEHLEDADYIVSTHRGHGHCIAKGCDFEGLLLENIVTKERSTLPVKGLFIAIGHSPATKFLQGTGIEFDDKGYAYTSFFISSEIVKWKVSTREVVDRVPTYYSIGHLLVPGGGTRKPTGRYVVAFAALALCSTSSLIFFPIFAHDPQGHDIEDQGDAEQHQPEREGGQRLGAVEFLHRLEQDGEFATVIISEGESPGREGIRCTEAVKFVSKVPSGFRRAMLSRLTPFTLVNIPPIRTFPSGCSARGYT